MTFGCTGNKACSFCFIHTCSSALVDIRVPVYKFSIYHSRICLQLYFLERSNSCNHTRLQWEKGRNEANVGSGK